jgi:hypothetical protein
MSAYKDFRVFYEKELLPDLEIIDRKRKGVEKRVVVILLIATAAIVTEVFVFPKDNEALRVMIPILTGVVGLIFISVFSRSYRQEYKKRIVTRIARFVDEGLTYNPEGTVPKSEFVKSEIFPLSCDKYNGEDHFSGKLGKTDIEFSEVVAKHRNTSGSGSNKKDNYSIIFRGLFIIADFNKHFKTHTLVLPDTAERLFGKFGQKLQSLSLTRGKLIRLEDPDFEKEFCVYGDDQVEARYILTPSLMERILTFKHKWNTTVYLSFLDSKVYIAIRMFKNLFEARLFKSVVDYDFMEDNLRFLTLITEIVDDLNLNTRIWTKE